MIYPNLYYLRLPHVCQRIYLDLSLFENQERLRLKKFINTLKEQGDYKLTIIGEASSDGVSSGAKGVNS